MVRLIHPELTTDNPELLTYRDRFLQHYGQHIAVETCLFDGMEEVLTYLDTRHIPWGIVTNKPRALSEALLVALGLDQRCAVLVCPDDVAQPKPHPEPMYLAAQHLALDPTHILYVGDHPRDIDAGRNAQMPTVLAAYGYLPPAHANDLDAWQADAIIPHADALLPLLHSDMFVLGCLDHA